MYGNEVFKNKVPIRRNLANFGFKPEKDDFILSYPIVNDQFTLQIKITANGQTETRVLDADTQEEYILYRAENVTGSYIGKIRTEVYNILKKIAEQCFETKIFQSQNANDAINYIQQKYHHHLEFLWDKFPENAIVRRSDNKKWYAVFLTVSRNKLGLSGNEKIEIIDLRAEPEEIKTLIDHKKYFGGYHMNKKHWITICLDHSVSVEEIYARIDTSFHLAKK